MKKTFLNLGRQPITNNFLNKDQFDNEYFYDLIVQFDTETKMVSIKNMVDPSKMFNERYAHRASQSLTMREHFSELSYKINFNKKVLEIGSNDGIFIKNFDPKNTIAVEPCSNFAKETQDMGYVTYPEFWTTKLANKIKSKHGKQEIIYAANCICHIPDLDDTFKGVESILEKGGQFIFEDPSLLNIIKNTSYDQIYDEHPHIFSVISLDNVLKRNGLQIHKVENLTVHGGSNRIYASRIGERDINSSVLENKIEEEKHGLDKFETFKNFANDVKKSKKELVNLLKLLKKKNKKIISYGATYKSTTIFNYCGIGPDLIDYVTDTTLDKQGKFTPGMHIPIISPEEGFNETVDYAFLGAWNFVKEIYNKESDFINRGGKFITHVPKVKIITKETPQHTFHNVKFHEDDRAQRLQDVYKKGLPNSQINISHINSTNHSVGWHSHKIQTEYWFVAKGALKVGLVNLDNKNPKAEFEYLSDKNPRILEIPPGIAHGYKAMIPGTILIYCISEKYDDISQFDDERYPIGYFGEDWNTPNK